MTYRTIMAQMKLHHTNTGLLKIVGDLGERFGSRVVGVVACQPIPIVYCDVPMSPTLMDIDNEEISCEMSAAEAEFRATFHGKPNPIEWRTSVGPAPPANFVALQSRCADLVVASAICFDPEDTGRREDPAQVVLQAGRPVLLVPHDVHDPKLDRVTIAWKDTRETRRAVTDAVPLLKTARHVSILHLGHERDRLAATTSMNDVASWLDQHGVVAEVIFRPASRGDDAYQLNACLVNNRTSLVVAGAYGHSRFHEWVLGGVTRDLTLHAGYCAFLSH
jgi:nucleotide-binding universal stress UspA family protein